MNVDAGDSALNSHICFNALATLQHIKNVENSCNFCSSSDHSTYVCPVLSQGEHVKDTSIENLSRSSVPHGLQVYENETGTHIISLQKFAKGCRFGPLLAPKSYIPILNTKFPLIIFGTVNLDMDAMNMPELTDLFKVRNIYLDTRNEKYCNWMIHVDPAQYVNEQNLIAYEEDNEIFFAAIEDLDVGDILKVWYSPKYGERMKTAPLQMSTHKVAKNVLQQGGFILPEIQLFNNVASYENEPNRTEISLPSIKNIIKPSAYVCYDTRSYTPISCLPHMTAMPSDNYQLNGNLDVNDSESGMQMPNKILNLDNRLLQMGHESLANFDEDEDDQIKCSNGDLGTAYSNFPLSGLEKDDKKIYPCQLCDKKYSTMTNIYRHVRTQHNYFLCSLCMNMFKMETDLKEHIHKCPKSDVKKPQCIVCMQYFSNSWSLTRHIKIHVSAGECDADILVERKMKERKSKDDGKDGIDLSDIEKNSRDSFGNELGAMQPEPSNSFMAMPMLCDMEAAHPIETLVSAAPTVAVIKTENVASNDINDSDNEISACIVCEKRFKSKSCMNKHLRSVHTVKVLSPTKRPATTSHSKSSSAKRSQLGESQSAITHTGSPVNPFTAKALASKLNERNSMLNGSNGSQKHLQSKSSGSTNKTTDIPMPPLISIQHSQQQQQQLHLQHQKQTHLLQPLQTVQHRAYDSECESQNGMTSETNQMLSKTGDDLEVDLNVPAFNILKKSPNQNSACESNKLIMSELKGMHSSSSSDELNQTNESTHQRTEKMHKCDLCGKKFNKKYELKRHKAVHENVTYTCPYCIKVVKRKPSMIKHLRISHKDFEHIWTNAAFIDNLKQHITPDNGHQLAEITDENEMHTMPDDAKIHEQYHAHVNRSVNYHTNNNNVFLNKPKKSSAIISYLKKMNSTNVKKYLLKNQTTEQFKKNLKLKISKATASVAEAQGANDVKKIEKHLNCSSKRSDSSNKNSSNGNSKTHKRGAAYGGNGVVAYDTNTPPMSPNLSSSSIAKGNTATETTTAAASAADIRIDKLVDDISSSQSLQCQQKQIPSAAVPSATLVSSDDMNVNNIIDNCFFVDDTLNCNVVLHSPFSSDNEVDGFIMSNSNENTTMNKELLNKFHDRLEEMEEKNEDSEFKVFWNEVLDDDNLNDVDDIVGDDNENGIEEDEIEDNDDDEEEEEDEDDDDDIDDDSLK